MTIGLHLGREKRTRVKSRENKKVQDMSRTTPERNEKQPIEPDKPKPNPQRLEKVYSEAGEPPLRRMDCRHYRECLDQAAFKRWPSWSCEGCEAYEPETPETW